MPLPGDPDALIAAADALEGAGRDLRRCGEAVTAHARRAVTGWTGVAAPPALARLEQDASGLRTSGESVTRASASLRRGAEELRGAQTGHAEGERMRSAGQAAAASVGSGAVAAADAARDAGLRAASDGEATMLAAEERARAADAAAAREIDAAAALLDGLVAPTAAPAPPPGSTIAQGASAAGNALASVGNAALHHPGAVAATVGGGLLATVSAAGVVAGTAATATGAGAPVGVPLGGLSAAGVATGVGLAGAGAIDLALNAAGPDRVSPFQVNTDAEHDAAPAERLRSVGEAGDSRQVRQVESDQQVRDLYDELSEGAEPLERGKYPGRWVTTADGTEIGIREGSRSGGTTIDAVLPNGQKWKVHVKR